MTEPKPNHPYIEFTFEITTTSGRQYTSGVLRQPYTADLALDKVKDAVVDRFTSEWSPGGLFIMAGPDDEPICLNTPLIEAVTIRWGGDTAPPAGEVAGGAGIAADYANSTE